MYACTWLAGKFQMSAPFLKEPVRSAADWIFGQQHISRPFWRRWSLPSPALIQFEQMLNLRIYVYPSIGFVNISTMFT